ncbi:START domain-containing protein [Oscillatoria amoena NRMC-F 0135]|nr:START domain-containing protein [Oscillatoria amoena NRMC-F 0135]
MRSVRLSFFIWLTTLVHLGTQAQTDCELKRSQDNIFVYACKVSDSKVKAIRANFILPTTLSVLAGHLLDVASYTQWQYSVIETEVLKQENENEVIYRAVVKAPWPVSNRELVVRLTISQDAETKVMTFTIISIPDYIPVREGVVRVPRSEGLWTITPVEKNKLKIDYQFIVDPGGSIPAWLLNLSIAEGPHKTFSNLTNRIKSGIAVTPAPTIID